MKKILLQAFAIVTLLATASCEKDTEGIKDVNTPRTSSVPAELVGRWAIVGISGSTVYDIPAGSTHNTNEYFLGYQINADGTTKEDGYISVYQYGVTTWTRWTAYGSVQIEGGRIAFHRAHGGYTSSRNSSTTKFGPSETYPNKTASFEEFEIGRNSRGELALFLLDADGDVHTYVKQ